jgi:hypothetical protein
MIPPPLTPLHPDETLIPLKLQQIDRMSTDAILRSLAPGHPDALKARPDGTMLDGHHRIHILRRRGVQVDHLPREVIPKQP